MTILVFTSAAAGLAYRNCTDNELEGHWYQIDFYGYRNGEYTSLGDGTLFLAVIESGGTGYPILGYVYGIPSSLQHIWLTKCSFTVSDMLTPTARSVSMNGTAMSMPTTT